MEHENSLFVTCAQGLEPLLNDELKRLGCGDTTPGFRGVYVPSTEHEVIYRINYQSRVATRVLLPLRRFRCYDQKSLYRGISSIEWAKYMPTGKTFAIDANVTHRQFRNSLFAAQVTKDAICDQFRQRTGTRPNVDVKEPDVQLNLFIRNEAAIISFDTSGQALHKRGYRLDAGEAPLRENFAAALLQLAQYQGIETLYDPCCGAGTLLIEAALIATRTAPGYLRKEWGFRFLPGFRMADWLKVKAEVDQQRVALPPHLIWGTEINSDVARKAKANLRAAGFLKDIEILVHDFQTYEPTIKPNLLITNPPHGNRLEDVDSLRPLYRALGDWMKRKMQKPSRGFIFTGNLDLAKEVGLAAKRRYVMDNGGIESRLLEFDLY